MHLHGYKYFVLAQGHGMFNKEKYLREHGLDLSNPLRRDTASAGKLCHISDMDRETK